MSRTAIVKADTNGFRMTSDPRAESSPGVVSRYQVAVVTSAMLVGALLLAGSGVIHLHLWLSGYRAIHIIGPLFLTQAISAFIVAMAVIVLRRTTVALAGTALLAGTIVGLLLSSWHGIFGFHESLGAPYAGLSLAAEGVGIAALALASISRHRLLKQRKRESETRVIMIRPTPSPRWATPAPVHVHAVRHPRRAG